MNMAQPYEEDIPVVIPAPMVVTDSDQQLDDGNRASLTKGRSSRVVIPDSTDGDPHVSRQELTETAIQTLKQQGFTKGLIDAMVRNFVVFPMRIWVVDNSGSMSRDDGHRIAESPSAEQVKLVKCSRWSELHQTVEYHAQIVGLLRAPTVFRLLNDPGKIVGPQQFSIAERGEEWINDDLQVALTTMKQASPLGCTPLSQHLVEIRENVMTMLPQLRSTGQKVVIILATDGLPTDTFGCCNSATRSEFESNLRSLSGLPVWIVVRLCTDEDSVVEYYNNLDSQLELSLEVLDDWIGEAKEAYEFNPWLNYGIVLHRVREMGFHHRLFDLLDERRLNLDELKEFFILLFGPDAFDGALDPQFDFQTFAHQVKSAVQKESMLWNPITNHMGPWVDMNQLNECYGDPKSYYCAIM